MLKRFSRVLAASALLAGTPDDQYLIASNAVILWGVWIGVGWLFRGITTVSIAASAKALPQRPWLIFLGVLTTIAGIILISAPMLVVTLAWVAGVFAVALGIGDIVSAFQLRKAAATVM